ncbi:MAG: prephenate dehydratase domain-containing protein [Candidatus Latescibacterota bacterium]
MSAEPAGVAVQGEPGSNSALAAAAVFGAPRILPCRTFADLFAAVQSRQAAYAMAPVENSLGGSVHAVWELLTRTPLLVVGEHYLHVRHCLIAHPHVPLQEIRRIYSHEQALAQCRRYLSRLVWIEPEAIMPVYDTAGAVRMVKARGKREEAAIASAQAAALHGMHVLAEDIQSDARNHTRFLILAGDTQPGPQALRLQACGSGAEPVFKTTLVVTVDGCARSLAGILGTLAGRRVPVQKVETRKSVGEPWAYHVYLDCLGRTDAEPLCQALSEVRRSGVPLRLVGSYPAAPEP